MEWISILEFLDVSDEIAKSKQTQDFYTFAAKTFGFEDEYNALFLTEMNSISD